MDAKRAAVAVASAILAGAMLVGAAGTANAGIVDDVDKLIGEKLAEIR